MLHLPIDINVHLFGTMISPLLLSGCEAFFMCEQKHIKYYDLWRTRKKPNASNYFDKDPDILGSTGDSTK